ncbi:MAG: response regulator, partial [Nannocystaceae bacterium]|nr:response regulator [Nannocystaceae bacterium]
MRVHVISSDAALSEAAQQELTADGRHIHVARAQAEVLIVDGAEPNLADLLLECGAETPRHTVLLLATPAQLIEPPDGITDLAAKPLRPGELAARLKVVHQRRASGPLKRLKLLAWAVEAAGDIIEITSPEPTFEYVNPAFTRVLGYVPSEIIGKTPASVMRSDMHEPGYFGRISEALDAGRPWKGLLISQAKDSSLVYLEATIAPVMDEDGTCTHHVAVKRDITARIEADNELRRQSAELEQARDAALEASRSKSQFLANMSHELRTPLNAIIGYSEMLGEDADDDGNEELASDLGRIKASGQHLLELINDVLDLSKIEAGAMRLHLESFDVHTTISNVVATVRPLVRAGGNTLDVEIDDDIGIMRADLTKVRQTLLNVLSNAAKFTKDGTITLTVTAAIGADGVETISFAVSDTGIGIEADTLKRLFKAFVQADATTTRNYGGTGLGLVISQRYCAMMAGDIDVKSTPGTGSTFTITLPRTVADEQEGQSSDTPEAADPCKPKCRVLAVDDDPAMLDLLSRALRRHGFEVLTARNGREGLAAVHEHAPAAVVLDVMMPELDGWGLLTELKGDPETADIPVVMLTILDQSDVGFALGAVDFLLKPVQTERLAAILRRFCGSGSGRILVVDDDAPSRDRMRRALQRSGHTVTESSNGREALEAMRDNLPHLVLLDLMMPEVDGFSVLKQMRADPRLRDVPVVVVT